MDQPLPTASPTPDGDHRGLGAGYVLGSAPVTAMATALPALSRGALVVRVGILGVAAAGLIAAAVLLFSSGTSPAGALAAGSPDGGNPGVVGLDQGRGPGFRIGARLGFGGITVTAINGNDISLKTADGWTRTITVDSGTTYTKSGASIGLGDLKVGDQIAFRQTREAGGSWTIDSITVVLPRVAGQVTKVDGSAITLTLRGGTTETVTVNGSTAYTVDGKDGAALSDVKVGMLLVAEGSTTADGSLTASRVRAVTASSIEGRGRFDGVFGRGGRDRAGQAPDATSAPSGTGTSS